VKTPFQLDKFHINNQTGANVTADYYSGFSLEDQLPVQALLLNDDLVGEEEIEGLKRATIILAQKEHENVLRPLSWGKLGQQHYLVMPDYGRPLSTYENLKALHPSELLTLMRGILRALLFAESKEVLSHGSVRPDNIRIALDSSGVKLGLFGYPTIELRHHLELTSDGPMLLQYFPPAELAQNLDAPQFDLYALGLISLELATGHTADEQFPRVERMRPDFLRQVLTDANLPLPVQELLYKLLSPIEDQRYSGYKQALEDVQSLQGQQQAGLRFTTFILDTLINGRFKIGHEIASGRVSTVYSALDLRETEETEDDRACVVKLIDLRAHPEMSELFHTRFKQMASLRHDHLMAVYDVGVHFENGYVAMESGLQSLEQLLIKRGTLPLPDAGRIIHQLCKALEGLQFHNVPYHGVIKPSNVFLSTDLKAIKLGDTIIADYFLRHGNLNNVGAEYYTPEFIKDQPGDLRTDMYSLGTLYFELLVGHPPFSFKIEDELKEEHLHLAAGVRVESSLIQHQQVKDIILRMLEKNPALRYQTVGELRLELEHMLGYDKKEVVTVPNLMVDFAELSMVGKNTREKSEETLAVRLPAVHNRARGVIALFIGQGKAAGDASKAAGSALAGLRELLFNPGHFSPELGKLQKADPEAFLAEAVVHLNNRLYREAFASGGVKNYGVAALIAMIQENTLYLSRIGELNYSLFSQGHIIDTSDDKWTVMDEITVGEADKALSADAHDRLGFGELVKVTRLKRRLRDGDQVILPSHNLTGTVSISEIKELVTSTSEPSQAIELIRGEAIRRRLEGTISCVLLSVGHVIAFAEENVSHARKGLLARNFLAQGDTFLHDGRVDEAIEQYNQALQVNPNFAIIHHQLGLAYLRKGLSTYAISCFERALLLNSKLPKSYLEIAAILRRQQRHKEVLPLFRKAVAEGCRDPELYGQLARELLKVRNFDEAILYCNGALEMDPQHPTAFRDRMAAVRRRGALDTKLLNMIAGRPRLAGGPGAKIRQSVEPSEDGEER
jgi:serine/threonine protein kinase/serine/threonine protein phosphatase PrpC